MYYYLIFKKLVDKFPNFGDFDVFERQFDSKEALANFINIDFNESMFDEDGCYITEYGEVNDGVKTPMYQLKE